MNTYFSNKKTGFEVTQTIREFYDLGSPYYYKVYGSHIHDGYYITGRETKEEAQINLIKMLIEKCDIKRGSRILDVGCGIGGSSIWLAQNLGATTTGITISPVQVKMATQLARKEHANSTFLLMNAEEMEFSEKFDLIWVVGVMTHLNNQQRFIERGIKYLVKEGKFVIFDWMLGYSIANDNNDSSIKAVTKGLLLASLYRLRQYTEWFNQIGCKIIYSEDITTHTVKTWDDALGAVRNPHVWKLAAKATINEIEEVLKFLKSIQTMRLAMRKGKLVAGAIVAIKN